jgi:hypothetical protein
VAWTTGSELLGELGQEMKKIEGKAEKAISERTTEKTEECF